MPTVVRKIFTDETEEELLQMTRAEVTMDLNDRQIAFCEHYVSKKNIGMAAIKAGYKKSAAPIVGYKLRQNPDVNRYIAWLKIRICQQCIVTAEDIIDKYARIAFADVTDFVEIKGNTIRAVNGDEIDGQLIKSIKQGRDGLSIELYDKLSALDKLERYLDVMPKDWRQKIEERKLEIMQNRLELERAKAGLGSEDEEEDDGFMEALKGSAKEVWDGEGE